VMGTTAHLLAILWMYIILIGQQQVGNDHTGQEVQILTRNERHI
jgi:hypothetical protein